MSKKQVFNFTPGGQRLEPVYKEVFDDETKKTDVREVDKIDIYEFVQASNSQSDLSQLREMMIRTGEIPAVDPDYQTGVDLTHMPKDIHELYDVVNNVDGVYNSLPDTIKSAFTSRDDFLNALVKDTYMSRVQTYVNEVAAKHASESAKGAHTEGGAQ